MVARLLFWGFLSAPLVSAVFPSRQPHAPRGCPGGKILAYNETTPPIKDLIPRSQSINWLPGDTGGQFVLLSKEQGLVLGNAESNCTSAIVPAEDVPARFYDYEVSRDLSYVLWSVNYTKNFRHSYYADYVLQDVVTLERRTIGTNISSATFSPSSDAIAYVKDNNVFVYNVTAAAIGDDAATQVTYDGSTNMFYGIHDWVYEEENAAGANAMYWAPDGSHLLFQSLNETKVPTYTVPYYINDTPDGHGPQYPEDYHIRYPKVGSPNPAVALQLLDMQTLKTREVLVDAHFGANDTLLVQTFWACEDCRHGASFVYKVTNRNQDMHKIVRVHTQSLESRVIASRNVTDGWLEIPTKDLAYAGALKHSHATQGASQNVLTTKKSEYYIGLSDETGWMHLYLYPLAGGRGIALTSGEWEIVDIVHVDKRRQLVYFLSKEHSSIDQHLYQVSYGSLTLGEKMPLVDDSVAGFWNADFSPSGEHFLLSYQGPDVPYQEIHFPSGSRTLTDNRAAYDKLYEYDLPRASYLELDHPDGFTLNVLEILPPKFSPHKKYPVLFNPYGGPNSQQVNTRFSVPGYNAYLASDPELEFITYKVDGRGTGYKGRAFRSAVTRQLGTYEVEDQLWAAKELARQKSFIDTEHIGMWGWSFGGYLTAKTIEANDGTFSYGLITAPVSDWRFYDSVYTERYMKQYSENTEGYHQSAVHNATGFKELAGGFAITHGTGDDNVHYQHSAVLIDFLIGSGVGPSQMKMMAFTDSDHSIKFGDDSAYLYKFLTERLWHEKNRVPGEKTQHQWSKKSFSAGPMRMPLPVQ